MANLNYYLRFGLHSAPLQQVCSQARKFFFLNKNATIHKGLLKFDGPANMITQYTAHLFVRQICFLKVVGHSVYGVCVCDTHVRWKRTETVSKSKVVLSNDDEYCNQKSQTNRLITIIAVALFFHRHLLLLKYFSLLPIGSRREW